MKLNLLYESSAVRKYTKKPLESKRVLSFEIGHLVFSFLVIGWHFFTAAYMDINNIRLDYNMNISNVAWTFTQFTWLTTMGITLMQCFRLMFRNKTFKSKFFNFFFGPQWYVMWVTYIFVVSFFFTLGVIYLIFIKSHNPDKKPTPPEPAFVRTSLLVTTILVHFVNPMFYVLIFGILVRKKYIQFDEITWKITFRNACIAFIYPLLYMIFYVIFALYEIDPYAVTDLKKNEGWWVAGVAPPSIFFTLWLFWVWIRFSEHRRQKQLQKLIRIESERRFVTTSNSSKVLLSERDYNRKNES